MRRMMEHYGLRPANEEVLARFTGRLKPPGYYKPDFSESDLAVIAHETGVVGKFFDCR